MSRRTRNDSASINFNVNLPPEVIREYFEGKAKVEAAKRPPAPESSEFKFSSLIPLLTPLLTPVITSLINQTLKSPTPLRVPEPITERHTERHAERDTEIKEKEPNIVISFVQNPVEDENLKDLVEELKSPVKDETPKEAEKNIPSESDKLPRRPQYEESDNAVQLNLGNFGAGLGGEGGLNEMMKMFAPMLQGLTSGLGGLGQSLPVGTKTTDSTSGSVSHDCNLSEHKSENLLDLMTNHVDSSEESTGKDLN